MNLKKTQFTLIEFILTQTLLGSYLIFLLMLLINKSILSFDVYLHGFVITVVDAILSASLWCNRRRLYRFHLVIVNAITVAVLFRGFILIPNGFLARLIVAYIDPIRLFKMLLCVDVLILTIFFGVAVFSRNIQKDWLYIGFSIITFVVLFYLDFVVLRETIANV